MFVLKETKLSLLLAMWFEDVVFDISIQMEIKFSNQCSLSLFSLVIAKIFFYILTFPSINNNDNHSISSYNQMKLEQIAQGQIIIQLAFGHECN